MRKRSIIAGAAAALSLAVAGTAQADTNTTTFDSFDNGSVDGQDGWKAPGPYDQAVVPVPGGKALRVSNIVTSGSFSDMPHSKPVTHAAGENEANNVLVNEFTLSSAVPDAQQPGLAMSVSPDDGVGSRMSYLRFEDHADGVQVFFRDATFTDQLIATLDRSVPHTIRFETTFVKGDANDVVRIFIDGEQKMRGASWEDYYRFDEERNPSPTDRLIIRTAGTAAPAGTQGFLFDDVTSESHHVNNPAPLNPPAPGPQGPQGPTGQNGTNGTNGTNGVDGVTTIIHDDGKLAGNTIRTLHARKIEGKQLLRVRASLRGKRLHAHGRSIKVDLRGKTVGNYHVVMVAKYKTKSTGKIHTVRTVRTLSIIRK
jgi:hypothetical protein